MDKKRIAIIGAGFSGTMLLVHLVHFSSSPLVITLLDKSGKFAEGVAYGTTNFNHLLNVRSGRLSAYPDQPTHFTEWLKLHDYDGLSADSFAPRRVYGSYLKDQLAQVLELAKSKGHEVHCLPFAVDSIHPGDKECSVIYGDETLVVDAVVLALGNLPPKRFTYEKKLFHTPDRFTSDIWNAPPHHLLHKDTVIRDSTEPVAIIGSGLTMVDSVISLRDKGYKGKIITISRHGHLPAIHESVSPYPKSWELDALPKTALGLLVHIRLEVERAKAEGIHWQAVIDSLRPITNPLWNALPLPEKRRFLRHLLSLWNIHRHRMPPESAAMIAEMQKSGQLTHISGTIFDTDSDGDGLILAYHQQYHPGIQTMRVSYLLNCTGPEMDIGKLSSGHLLYRLWEPGYITVGTLRSGIEQSQGYVKGGAAGYLFTLGPVCFGGLFETTAVPELRVQAKELAQNLLTFLKEKHTNNFAI